MKDFKSVCLHAALFGSVVLLAPCRGDEGTNPGPDPAPEPANTQPAERYPDIDWPLSPQQVRSFFSGSALNLSSDEIESIYRDILGAASTLLLSDYIEFHILHTGSRLPTVCDGDSCEVTISGDQPTVTITLSDLQNSELSETQSVMTYQNVSLVQGRARDNEDGVIFEILSYGGWQEYHVFSAQAAFLPSADNFEQILIHGYSIGSPTGTNPVSGSGTWRGVMVGTEVHRGDDNSGLIHHFLQGDAELKLSFLHELEAEVYFTNIRYLDTGDFLDDMGWTHLHLEDGRFRGGVSIRGSGWVDGYFYGPDHEEAGGIFELDSIVGAFGAERVPGPSFFRVFLGYPGLHAVIATLITE